MTPLGGSLLGMSVVALDLRLNGFDFLMDPVGWGIVAVMVGRLAGVRPAFRVASVASWVGVLVSLPQLVGEVWGVLPDCSWSLLQTVVLVSMCTGMIAVIGPEHRSATGLNVDPLGRCRDDGRLRRPDSVGHPRARRGRAASRSPRSSWPWPSS